MSEHEELTKTSEVTVSTPLVPEIKTIEIKSVVPVTVLPTVTATISTTKENNTMAFSFTSIGHALATGLHDVYTGAKAVESFIAKAATPGNEAKIEALTALVPVVGTQAVVIERGVFAVAGQLLAILTTTTDAGEQKLLDAGFDQTVINDFKALVAQFPGLFSTSTAATVSTAVVTK